MTDNDTARRIAADYLAALNDAEASAFVAETRTAQQANRDFARQLFGDPEQRAANNVRILFDR